MGRKTSVVEEKTVDLKTLRKEYVKQVYQFLEPEETILETDEEYLTGGWRPTRSKWVGTGMLAKHKGCFRRKKDSQLTFEEFVAARTAQKK